MWKRPVIISFIITFIGILALLYRAFSWKFLIGFQGFLIGAYSVIIIIILSLVLIIGSVFYTVFVWRKEGFIAFLPLVSSILVILLYFSALPGKVTSSYQSNFFERNFHQYSEAVSIMKNVKVSKDNDWYELPPKYRYLSEDGKIQLIDNDSQKEIVFFLRRAINSGEFIVYTTKGETVFSKYKYYRVIKKKPNWYYVLDEG